MAATVPDEMLAPAVDETGGECVSGGGCVAGGSVVPGDGVALGLAVLVTLVVGTGTRA